MIDNNMMDMGIDGGSGLEGTKWWKRDGSDHFEIREVLLTDTGFTIRTTDGRLMAADVMDNYIQSETPITGQEGKRAIPRIDPSQLEGLDSTAVVADEKHDFGSLKYSHPGVKFNQNTGHQMIRKEPDPLNDPIGQPATQELDAVCFGMIDRVLGGIDMKDIVSIRINPIEKVNDGIKILANTLNIKRNELRLYMANYIDGKFADMLDEALDLFFDKLLGPEKDLKKPSEES